MCQHLFATFRGISFVTFLLHFVTFRGSLKTEVIVMSGFSEMLTYLRKREGYSQQELSEKLSVSRSAISMYESGKREPDYETLEELADFFNVNMSTLLGKSDAENIKPNAHSGIELNPDYFNLSKENKALIDSMIEKLLKSQSGG